MKAAAACEPLFLRLCQLHQEAGQGRPVPGFEELRREISDLLSRVHDSFSADPELAPLWSRIELPLLFFIDSFFAESPLPCAGEWNRNRLAYEFKELAGDQKFFDLLKETAADTDASARLLLSVFYTCIGLGFTGYHGRNTKALRLTMDDLVRRVDPGGRTEALLRICPEAYQNVDTRVLVETPPLSSASLTLLYLSLMLVVGAVVFYLYQESTIDLRRALVEILQQAGHSGRSFLRFFL